MGLIEILPPGQSDRFRVRYLAQAREAPVLPAISQLELSGRMPSSAGALVLKAHDFGTAGGHRAHRLESTHLRNGDRDFII